MKGKAKPEISTSSFLTTVGSTAGNAAYSAFTYLSGATPVPTVEEKKDLVTFTKFEDIELVEGQDPVHCLLIGYQSGFQIWDLTQSEKILAGNTRNVDLKVNELMSEQGYHVRDLCVFNRIKGKTTPIARPLIGIVSENKAQSSNTKILLYSILLNETKKSIEFLNPIVRVIGNDRAICVVCTEYVVLLDAETFEKKYYIPLYRGNAVTQGTCCLGPCWFAFQSPHSLGDRVEAANASAIPSIWSVAGNLVDTANSIKTQVAPQITAYLYGTNPASVSPSNSDLMSSSPTKGNNIFANEQSEEKGLVTIIDLESESTNGIRDDGNESHQWENSNIVVVGSHDEVREKKFLNDSYKRQLGQDNTRSIHHHFRVISQFKADEAALSCVAFNPGGTLLATASELGKEVKVFAIDAKANIFESHQLLYVLQRGLSSATIMDIHFSNDSFLVACTSSNKGTTHVFGIHPKGGVVDLNSHLRSRRSSNYEKNGVKLDDRHSVPAITPAKLGIIRASDIAATTSNPLPFAAMTTKFLHRKSDYYIFLTAEPNGQLNSYAIRLIETNNGASGEQLGMEIVPKFEWLLTKGSTFHFTEIKKALPSNNSPELEASHAKASQANAKDRDREDQSWKENIERCPCQNYRCFAGSEQNPVEVYNDPIKFDILSITDPLKLDDAYGRLQSTLVVQKSSNGKSRPDSTDLSPQRQRGESKGEHARDSAKSEGVHGHSNSNHSNGSKEREHHGANNTNASSNTSGKGSNSGEKSNSKKETVESPPEKKSTAKKSSGASSKGDPSGPSTRQSKQQQDQASQGTGKHAEAAEKSVKSTKKEKTKPQVSIENLSISRIMDDV